MTEQSINMDRLREIIREKSLNLAKPGEFFTLASGNKSTYFFDMKPSVLDSKGSALIAEFILANRGDAEFVGGMETGAIPIVGSVCSVAGMKGIDIEGFFIRKSKKERGTEKLVEGNLGSGEVLMVEDVTTTAGSVIKALDVIREAGGTVKRVITILDREAGAEENLKSLGIELISMFKKSEFVKD